MMHDPIYRCSSKISEMIHSISCEEIHDGESPYSYRDIQEHLVVKTPHRTPPDESSDKKKLQTNHDHPSIVRESMIISSDELS
jgi:hypothetical protein